MLVEYSVYIWGHQDYMGYCSSSNSISHRICYFSFFRLESDIKRLKTDLQMSRNTEQEVRSQMNSYLLDDKNCRSELYQLQQDNENLQNK